jgi:hypothetical protein
MRFTVMLMMTRFSTGWLTAISRVMATRALSGMRLCGDRGFVECVLDHARREAPLPEEALVDGVAVDKMIAQYVLVAQMRNCVPPRELTRKPTDRVASKLKYSTWRVTTRSPSS